MAASDAAASTLPALNALPHHVRRTTRLPASTLTAAMAGPTPGGSRSTASSDGRAPRLTFCSVPILTGYLSASTPPARHTGTNNQRHGWAAVEPPSAAAVAARTTPTIGTPTTTAFRRVGELAKGWAQDSFSWSARRD